MTKRKCPPCLEDKASNMEQASKDTDVCRYECFAHSLQLVVYDGVLSLCVVSDLLTICRHIVGIF